MRARARARAKAKAEAEAKEKEKEKAQLEGDADASAASGVTKFKSAGEALNLDLDSSHHGKLVGGGTGGGGVGEKGGDDEVAKAAAAAAAAAAAGALEGGAGQRESFRSAPTDASASALSTTERSTSLDRTSLAETFTTGGGRESRSDSLASINSVATADLYRSQGLAGAGRTPAGGSGMGGGGGARHQRGHGSAMHGSGGGGFGSGGARASLAHASVYQSGGLLPGVVLDKRGPRGKHSSLTTVVCAGFLAFFGFFVLISAIPIIIDLVQGKSSP